jgi:prephenate dehydrogenase
MRDFIIEDWERESLKDQIYILEMQKEMEEAWQEWEHINRQPAKIIVVKPEEHDENANILEFPENP